MCFWGEVAEVKDAGSAAGEPNRTDQKGRKP